MPTTVRYGGAWRNAIPLVRYGGAWRNALVYVRHGGVWKLLTFTIGVSPASAVGGCSRTTPGSCTAQTNHVYAQPQGGSGNYSYQWEYVSGDEFAIITPTMQGTAFSRTADVGSPERVYTGYYRCRVTDNVTGAVAYTPNVMVQTSHSYTV